MTDYAIAVTVLACLGILITIAAVYAWWSIRRELREHAAMDALARECGVLVEMDPHKAAAVREALRQDALVQAHVRRDLTDERLAAWIGENA